eukprot:6259085-Pyramimonas_sp.AAC.2
MGPEGVYVVSREDEDPGPEGEYVDEDDADRRTGKMKSYFFIFLRDFKQINKLFLVCSPPRLDKCPALRVSLPRESGGVFRRTSAIPALLAGPSTRPRRFWRRAA